MILFYMIFLAILFLMCSTDLIIREPEKEIYQIAVIIEDVRDDNYSNFRKGMDQAAIEFNADVRFITLYEKYNADQQMELIDREQQDGADGLIVAPVDESRVVSALIEKQANVPVVLLGSGFMGQEIAEAVVIDYKAMGEKLAGHMVEDMDRDCLVLMLSNEKNQSIMSSRFLEGAAEVLEHEGYTCRIGEWREGQGMEVLAEMLGELSGKQAVILAESPEILTEAAGSLADNPLLTIGIRGLYGRGSTMAILNYLDREVIAGVCVTDEFSTGYFSVQRIIEALEGLRGQEPVKMESYFIQKKNLREPAYEKMLFPIE